MAVAWPTGFPAPAREAYGYTQANLLQRTSFAHGTRVRRLYTDDSDLFSVVMILSPGQWAEFQGWLRYEAKDGALYVNMPLIAAGTIDFREVRIIPPLRHDLIGVGHVRISFSVETRVGTTPSEEFYEYIKELGGGEAAFKFADLLNYAMNTQIPSFAEII